MKYLFLAIFIITTTIHLYASLKKNQKLRNYSKPWILLSLLGYYLCASREIKIVVVLALIFSWIGDMFLIIPGVKWFTIGGISFMISHFFFILSYSEFIDFQSLNKVIVVLLICLFVLAASIIFKYLKPYLPKPLFYPMYLYLIINGMMNCFAWFRSMCCSGWPCVVTAIGALLFFISDSSLFFVRFNSNSRLKTHFLVMLTYSIGELLIVLGLVLA